MGLRATYLDFFGSTFLPGGRQDDIEVDVPTGGDITFLPSAALSWTARPGLTAYLRYQRGSRVGGYALDTELPAGPTGVGAQGGYVVFRPDTLDTYEAGLRLAESRSPIQGRMALSLADWRSIQADLYGTTGPHTVNIGDGRIWGLETTMQWRPQRDTRLSGSLFLARSVLTDPVPAFARERRQALPNTPAIAASVSLDRRWSLMSGDDLLLRGSVRYTGRSWVGVGPLHLPQGDYVQVNMGLSWTHGPTTLTLDVSNLLDATGDRFAVGNPLALSQRRQSAPLQPRSLTIGGAWSF